MNTDIYYQIKSDQTSFLSGPNGNHSFSTKEEGIVDIKMRMLKEKELLPIQGFPPDYIEKVRAMGIKVTGTDAKKYIGNSQEVTTAKCLLEAYGPELSNLKEQYLKNAA